MKPKKHITYKIILICIILLFFQIVNTLGDIAQKTSATSIQEGIADEIIRLHVIANSDSEDDQNLKYKVKDAICEAFGPLFNEAQTIEEAREQIKETIPEIKEVALRTIQEQGYHYPVHISLSHEWFPVKSYAQYTLPAGTYEALRIQIGDANGQNWWCIMFPPLCFVSSTYSFIPADTDIRLQHVLTDKEYEEITTGQVKVKVRFRFLEYIESLLS